MAGNNCIHVCFAMHGAPLLVTPCTADQGWPGQGASASV
jgi:hypothetical protein